MAEDRASIDDTTVLDNIDERQVEFAGEVSGDLYSFALQYSVLEALSGAQIGEDAEIVVLFEQFRDEIEEAAAKALARSRAVDDLIEISESDIV